MVIYNRKQPDRLTGYMPRWCPPTLPGRFYFIFSFFLSRYQASNISPSTSAMIAAAIPTTNPIQNTISLLPSISCLFPQEIPPESPGPVPPGKDKIHTLYGFGWCSPPCCRCSFSAWPAHGKPGLGFPICMRLVPHFL